MQSHSMLQYCFTCYIILNINHWTYKHKKWNISKTFVVFINAVHSNANYACDVLGNNKIANYEI